MLQLALTGLFQRLLTFVAIASAVPSRSLRVSDVRYGDDVGLDISCGPDELIMVESESLSYSGGGERNSSNGGFCQPRPLCSVPYSQARWYCRGKRTCRGMLIERQPLHRRTCGRDYTDCLRVTYRCVRSRTLGCLCRSNAKPVAQQGSEGPWFSSNFGALPFPHLHFPLPSPAPPPVAKRPPNPARGPGGALSDLDH